MKRIIAIALLFVSAIFAQPTPPEPPKAPRAKRVVEFGGPSSFLGVGVAEIDAERAKALKLKEEHGVEVKNVDGDSPASKAGLKVGDVVLEYNGQRVEGMEQFMRFVRETPVGRQVKLLLFRNGSSQTVTAAIGSRPAGTMVWRGDDFKFNMPEIRVPMPEVRIDIPRALMSWQSRALGIETESLGSQLAEYFGVKEGVLVRAVTRESAAEKAGLKAGDVITKMGDYKIAGSKDLTNALRSLPSGKAFPVTVTRDRKETTLNVTIEEKSSRERIRYGGPPRPRPAPSPAFL